LVALQPMAAGPSSNQADLTVCFHFRHSPVTHVLSLFFKAQIFIQRGNCPHNSKEVMITKIDDGPFQGTLVCAGPFPARGNTALPATRQFQVEREWCPVIVLRK